LGDLMTSETKQSQRKDTLEGLEMSIQAKKALEEKKKKANEFECTDEDFHFVSSSITVIEAKAPKKKRKRWIIVFKDNLTSN